MKNLSGKVIWITGGTRGIGFETAKYLTGTNCNLILSSSNQSSIDKANQYLNNKNNIIITKCDLKSNDEVSHTYSMIKEKFGKVDVLMNNAGVIAFNSIAKSSIEEFDNMLEVNLKGSYRCIKSVLPDMLDTKSGNIINIISVVAQKAFAGSGLYSATKAGLMALSNSLREEVKKSNIKVINVYPGATSTEIWDPRQVEKFGELMMKPSEIGQIMGDIVIQSLTTSVCIEEIVLRPVTGDL